MARGIALQKTCELAQVYYAQNPDLRTNIFFSGGTRKPDPTTKYFLQEGRHPEQKEGEEFLMHVRAEEFKTVKKKIKHLYPGLRMGKTASLCHRANGKPVKDLKPVFFKKRM